MSNKIRRVAVRHSFDKIAANEKYAKYFKDIDVNSIHFYIDMGNREKILDIIAPEKYRPKFLFIIRELLNITANEKLYEHIVGDVYEMRLQGATRIICKEIPSNSPKAIVLSIGEINKGTTGKDFRAKAKNVDDNYEYTFYNNYQEYEREEG